MHLTGDFLWLLEYINIHVLNQHPVKRPFYKIHSYLLLVHLVYIFLFDLQLQISDQHTSVEDL